MSEQRSGFVGRTSAIGKAALVFTVVSAIGLIVLLVGGWAGIEGAREGEEGPIIFDVLWLSFSIGGIIAAVLGIASLINGVRKDHDANRTAGLVTLGYVVVALLLVMFAP